MLRLAFDSVKEAIKRRYIRTLSAEHECHLIIAGYYRDAIGELRPEPHEITYYKDIVYHLVSRLVVCHRENQINTGNSR